METILLGKILKEICEENPELFARGLLRIPETERDRAIHELAMVTNLARSFWQDKLLELGQRPMA